MNKLRLSYFVEQRQVASGNVGTVVTRFRNRSDAERYAAATGGRFRLPKGRMAEELTLALERWRNG